MPHYCYRCRSYFSVGAGTAVQQSKMGYQKWAIATYLFATNPYGVSSMKLRRDLGITQKSARFMVQRLRESWKRLAGLDRMEDPVGIDGALVGGLEKNKHVDEERQKAAAVGAKG